MNLEEMDWIHQSQGTGLVANCCERCDEPSLFIKCGEFLD
jgi:hypothetical protein